MPESALIDTALGLFALYALLSLLCTAVGELVSTALKMRASFLAVGIQRLLTDEDVRKRFYSHPFIQSLGTAATPLWSYFDADAKKGTGADAQNSSGGVVWPSYISNNTFAQVLLNALPDAAAGAVAAAGAGAVPGAGAAAGAGAGGAAGAGATPVDELKGRIEKLPDGQLKTALQTAVKDAGDDLKTARANIEEWYENTMTRIGGVYKRRQQIILFILGFILAIAFDADTIRIAGDLAKNPKLQQEVASKAVAYEALYRSQSKSDTKAPEAKDPGAKEPATKDPATKDLEAKDSGVKGNEAKDTTAKGQAVNSDDLAKKMDQVDKINNQLYDLGLQLGWRSSCELENLKNNTYWVILGWSLTAIALSLGAPFWFDLIGKVAQLRGSGSAPTKPNPQK